ncbi:hypothetical protein FISHEDRAFT_61578 [Fistulina hepatica ATCC 64428]|uniref:Uncharacterized protein n=1 Tax=Fistulina hepatica ATCC 64428 TaxID=1128425 RepID=A0A0D7A3F5_9AGAR|nr:hypothetical protein FISHEDRAFT_61578 [Fistulina hepatica ATCC 64428]
MSQAPTIDDLRVKSCYICLEEERHDGQLDIRFECVYLLDLDCLIKWINSSDRSARNTRKCPQCGFKYRLISDNPHPHILRVLDAVHVLVANSSRAFVLGISTGAIALMLRGLHELARAYGEHAMRCFIGPDLFEALAGSDRNQWPVVAQITLPLTSFILLGPRHLSTDALLCIFASWTTLPWAPRGSKGSSLIASKLPFFATPQIRHAWPPTPMLFALAVPLIRLAYARAFSHLSEHLLGLQPVIDTDDRRRNDFLWNLNRGMIHIRMQVNNADADDDEAPAAGDGNDNDNGEERPQRLLLGGISSLTAFVLPTLVSSGGEVLRRLAKKSSALRAFLGIREGQVGIKSLKDSRTEHPLRELFVVSKLWTESDPVWWRNSIALGILVVARDVFQLIRQYLRKRELDSLSVVNQDFADVDPSTLDLVQSES